MRAHKVIKLAFLDAKSASECVRIKVSLKNGGQYHLSHELSSVLKLSFKFGAQFYLKKILCPDRGEI